MSEPKFTPAPWWLTHNDEWVVGIDETVGTTCVAVGIYDTHNAHLIAAAPEMYEMLDELRQCAGYISAPEQDRLEDILKKARGENV